MPGQGRKVNYSRFTNRPSIRPEGETRRIRDEERRSGATIAYQLMLLNIYPSILNFVTIRKAVRIFFLKKTYSGDPRRQSTYARSSFVSRTSCRLDLLRRGVLRIQRRREERTRVSNRGGHESASLTGLVASYPFEKSTTLLNRTTYRGIYRNAGLVFFKGEKSVREIKDWSADFQHTADKATGNRHL